MKQQRTIRHVSIMLGVILALVLVACSGVVNTLPRSSEPNASAAPSADVTAPTVPSSAPSVQPSATTVPTATAPPATSAATASIEPSVVPTAAVPTTTAPAATAPIATATTTSTATVPISDTTQQFGSEIVFLRNAVLVAYDPASRDEREITTGVSSFATPPDGRTLALVRGEGRQAEIWLVDRAGSDLRQVTDNDRAERGLSWSPDGLTLAYASADADTARPLDWQGWSTWCSASEVRLLDLSGGTEQTLGAGCDPAFSSDGRRIAYVTPPGTTQDFAGFPSATNTIRMVNRQGQNGWDFATAAADNPDNGLLVYAPAWSPDSSQVAYQRFIGYQSLVDVAFSEIGNAFDGNNSLMSSGAGWLLPPLFAPDGQRVVLVQHNFSDARGFTGYDVWQTSVLTLGQQSETVLPSGTLQTNAATTDSLVRATNAAWSPDSSVLVVSLPASWSADVSPNDPSYASETAGELWRWVPGSSPSERLVSKVDFASPLAWLPATPLVAESAAGYHLAYPSDWQLTTSTEVEELTARSPDAVGLISAKRLPIADLPSVAESFTYFVGDQIDESEPTLWPDGSLYRSFSGVNPEGVPIAGAMRGISVGDEIIGVIYITTADRWPVERAQAQALLAASGS